MRATPSATLCRTQTSMCRSTASDRPANLGPSFVCAIAGPMFRSPCCEIFPPFTRAPSKGEPDGARAALGLAIAQRAVVAHGGSITARNAPDGGLVMEIELPLMHE